MTEQSHCRETKRRNDHLLLTENNLCSMRSYRKMRIVDTNEVTDLRSTFVENTLILIRCRWYNRSRFITLTYPRMLMGHPHYPIFRKIFFAVHESARLSVSVVGLPFLLYFIQIETTTTKVARKQTN